MTNTIITNLLKVRISVILIATLVFLFPSIGDPDLLMVLLTVILIFYNGNELFYFFGNKPISRKVLFSPILITVILTLTVGYGLSNVLFIKGIFNLEAIGIGGARPINLEMIRLVALSITASVAIWLGHYSTLSNYFSSVNFRNYLDLILPKAFSVRHITLLLFFGSSILSRLIQQQLDIFGYCSSYSMLIDYRKYTYFLSIMAELGKFGMVATGVLFFSNPKKKVYLLWLILFFINEVIFGILSGFKTPILYPFILILMTWVLAINKIDLKLFLIVIPAFLFLIFSSFQFVETFRTNVNKTRNIENSACSSKQQVVLAAQNSIVQINKNTFSNNIASLLARFNYSYIGSFGLAYKDRNGDLPSNFLIDIIQSPLHAIIPRILWDGKSLANIGHFYNQKVIGIPTDSSTAMGPVTYLYIAGGLICIVVIFFIIGIFQQAFYSLLFIDKIISGKIIFIFLLWNFSSVDSSVNSFFIDFFRLIPLSIFLSHLLFRRS